MHLKAAGMVAGGTSTHFLIGEELQSKPKQPNVPTLRQNGFIENWLAALVPVPAIILWSARHLGPVVWKGQSSKAHNF